MLKEKHNYEYIDTQDQIGIERPTDAVNELSNSTSDNTEETPVNIFIPTTKKLSDCERFIEGLKILANECHMTSIKYNELGIIIQYFFADGTYTGCGKAHELAGLIKFKK